MRVTDSLFSQSSRNKCKEYSVTIYEDNTQMHIIKKGLREKNSREKCLGHNMESFDQSIKNNRKLIL